MLLIRLVMPWWGVLVLGCYLVQPDVADVSPQFPGTVGRCLRVTADIAYVEGRNDGIAEYDALQLGRPVVGKIPAGSELVIERVYYERAIEYSAVWVVARWEGTTVEVGRLLSGAWLDAARNGLIENSDVMSPAGPLALDPAYASSCVAAR